MKSFWPATVASLALVLFRNSSGSLEAAIDLTKLPPAATGPVDFATQVEPLLAERCYNCHGEKKQSAARRIAKQKILRLFDLQFIDIFGCAVLIGATGLGKTHLLTALGYVACEKGISVRFTRAIDMINVLTTAHHNGTLERKLKEYVRPQLLLLDELGYLPIDKRGADLMFQVVASRYETGSIVISTNRVFKEWGQIFDVDNTLATAMIDRLMHHGEAVSLSDNLPSP